MIPLLLLRLPSLSLHPGSHRSACLSSSVHASLRLLLSSSFLWVALELFAASVHRFAACLFGAADHAYSPHDVDPFASCCKHRQLRALACEIYENGRDCGSYCPWDPSHWSRCLFDCSSSCVSHQFLWPLLSSLLLLASNVF